MIKHKMRSSNIEFLRILLIIMVIGLHYNAASLGNAFQYTQTNGINVSLTHLIESFMIMSVDTFLIITGYFLSTKKTINKSKIIEIIILLLVLKLILYLIDVIFYGTKINLHNFIQELLSGNWYITKYLILYMFSPYINKLLNSLNKKEYKTLIFITISIFLLLPFVLNILSTFFYVNGWAPATDNIDDSGYTIVNFFVMYLIGAYLRKERIELKLKDSFLGYVGCAIVVFLIYYIMTKIGYNNIASMAFRYNNIFVVLEAIFIFLFFNQLNISNNKIINTISSTTLSIFIIHTSTPFIKLYSILKVQKYCITKYLIPHFITTILILFILSLIIGLVTITILNKTIYKVTREKIN